MNSADRLMGLDERIVHSGVVDLDQVPVRFMDDFRPDYRGLAEDLVKHPERVLVGTGLVVAFVVIEGLELLARKTNSLIRFPLRQSGSK